MTDRITHWVEFFQVMTKHGAPAAGSSVLLPYCVATDLDAATIDVLARTHGMFTLAPGADRSLSKDARQWIDEFSEGTS